MLLNVNTCNIFIERNAKNFPKKIDFPSGSVVKTELSMQETQIWSLVGELRTHMPLRVAKKKSQ